MRRDIRHPAAPAARLERAGREPGAAILVSAVIALAFLAPSVRFAGPAYLQDEIGYLLNAAALTGARIDGASSYHFGYSLFLAPAFLLSEDANVIWRLVQATNAILIGASVYVLHRLSERLAPPETAPRLRLLAVALCALYPAWFNAIGYAFATPAIIFVFLLSVFTLSPDGPAPRQLALHGALVGFLFWIHPTGAAVAIASSVALVAMGYWHRRWAVVVPILIQGAMIWSYQFVLHPMLVAHMTPDGLEPALHYRGLVTSDIGAGMVGEAIVRLLGQFSYLAVGTLGFAFVGMVACLRAVLTDASPARRSLHAYLLLSLVGVGAMGALLFTYVGAQRTDHWMYGRYIEAVAAPVLLLGLLSARRAGAAALPLLTLAAFCGLAWLSSAVSFGEQRDWWGLNGVNAAAFWPVVLESKASLGLAMAVGAAGIAVTMLLPNRRAAMALLAVAFALSIQMQAQWHARILSGYSKPTSLPAIVRDTWRPGTCVGVDPDLPFYEWELAKLYTFHLHAYDIRRMDFADWLADCQGPYFTVDRSLTDRAAGTASMLAMERRSDLLMMARNDTPVPEPASDILTADQTCGGLWAVRCQ